MIIRLKRTLAKYPDLTLGLPYFVIGIEADAYRILNDHGKPYLFEPKLFDVVDPVEPPDWISEVGEEGEQYAYPESLKEAGFFEDFLDGKSEAIREFWHVVNQRLSRVA